MKSLKNSFLFIIFCSSCICFPGQVEQVKKQIENQINELQILPGSDLQAVNINRIIADYAAPSENELLSDEIISSGIFPSYAPEGINENSPIKSYPESYIAQTIADYTIAQPIDLDYSRKITHTIMDLAAFPREVAAIVADYAYPLEASFKKMQEFVEKNKHNYKELKHILPDLLDLLNKAKEFEGDVESEFINKICKFIASLCMRINQFRPRNGFINEIGKSEAMLKACEEDDNLTDVEFINKIENILGGNEKFNFEVVHLNMFKLARFLN